jgi:hypothetical protein
MAKTDETVREIAFRIGPAMHELIGHPSQLDWCDRLTIEVENADQPTHQLMSRTASMT